jgi:hypothetical protein
MIWYVEVKQKGNCFMSGFAGPGLGFATRQVPDLPVGGAARTAGSMASAERAVENFMLRCVGLGVSVVRVQYLA